MDVAPLPALLLWHSSPILRESLVDWCEGTFPGHPACQADSPAHALALAAVAHPRVALIDVDTRPGASLTLIRRLRARHPGLASVALTLYHPDTVRANAIAAGAVDCICIASAEPRLSAVVGALLRSPDPGIALRPEGGA